MGVRPGVVKQSGICFDRYNTELNLFDSQLPNKNSESHGPTKNIIRMTQVEFIIIIKNTF